MVSSRQGLFTRLRVLLLDPVFVAVFVMLWLGLSSLTGGPYKQPLDLDTSGSLVLTNWSATVAFSGLVLYPLLYRGQVMIHWLDRQLKASLFTVWSCCCKGCVSEAPPIQDKAQVSNKEQRHIRKKARRKAARATKPSEASNSDDPDVPSAYLPPDAPATNQKSSKDPASSSSSSPNSSLPASGGPQSAAPAPADVPPRQPAPTADPQGQEGLQPTSAKQANGKKVAKKKAKISRRVATDSTAHPGATAHNAPLLPRPPSTTSNNDLHSQEGWQPAKKGKGKKAATAQQTPSIATNAPAASGAAASRQDMPGSTPPVTPGRTTGFAPRAPMTRPAASTATPGFAASDRPLDPMGQDDVLVGREQCIKALKHKLAALPEAVSNLSQLETGSAGIKAFRPVRGDGNCGYRAVLAGIIGHSQTSVQLKTYLLQRMPEVLEMVLSWDFVYGVGTAYINDLRLGCTFIMEAVANRQGFPIETLLGRCRQQKASDQMLLFVRAICAAGLMQEPAESLVTLQALLAADKVVCSDLGVESCLMQSILPLGGRNQHKWYDDMSTKGLVAALDIGIRVFDINAEDAPLTLTYPEGASEVSVNLIKHGAHYDIVY